MKRLMKPKAVVLEWEKLLRQFKRIREKEMKKPVKDRVKKNLKTGPGGRVARQYAAKCGMKSMGEVYCAADMDKRKVKWDYEKDKLDYVISSTYNPDFTLDNGTFIEYKGKMTDTTRTKLVAVKRDHPDKKLCIVFERANNKLSSRPNSWKYWEWAERNGFPWSEGVIRKEWTK